MGCLGAALKEQFFTRMPLYHIPPLSPKSSPLPGVRKTGARLRSQSYQEKNANLWGNIKSLSTGLLLQLFLKRKIPISFTGDVLIYAGIKFRGVD
jgi:hypothetical protein